MAGHDGFCSLPSQRLVFDPKLSWGMNKKGRWALSLDKVPVLNKTMWSTIIRLLAVFPWAILTHLLLQLEVVGADYFKLFFSPQFFSTLLNWMFLKAYNWPLSWDYLCVETVTLDSPVCGFGSWEWAWGTLTFVNLWCYSDSWPDVEGTSCRQWNVYVCFVWEKVK